MDVKPAERDLETWVTAERFCEGSTVGSPARLAVRFEITVRYEIFWAKSMVRNYGTIYFPRYGTVRKYDIFSVLF